MPDSLNHLTIDVTAGQYAVVAVVTMIAGVTDALWLKISNWLTLPLLAGGLLFHAFAPSQMGVLFALLGAGLGFGLLVVFFIAGGLGAGDVKLLSAIGAWIGPHDVLVLYIVSAFLVGLGSLILWTWNRKHLPENSLESDSHARKTLDSLTDLDDRARRARLVPMGTMIAVALGILMMQDAFH